MERRGISICYECISALRQQPKRARLAALAPLQQKTRRHISAQAHNEALRTSGRTTTRKHSVKVLESLLVAARSAHTISAQDLNALHNRILELTNTALKPEDGKLPSEQRVLYVLEQLQALVTSLINGQTIEPASKTEANQETSATSALLGSVNTRAYPAFISKASLLNLASERAEELLRHPNIFITPGVLKAYVQLQTTLHQPASLADAFHLYAHKPIPIASGSKIAFKESSPNALNSAVDPKTGNLALDAALATNDLPLAIDIITTTFSTPAFKRSKLLRQCLLPLSGLLVLPLGAWTASSQFALLQNSMDPAYATGVAFAGTLAYLGHVGTIGYVAITTANDQMERVTWAQGVPLWERFLREEERAACDRVAGRWGFEDRGRRGEEEGGEWEVLREFVGVRGMVLDRAELMEGME
ncbi:hypothetical protein LTR78_007605 [Recurvomyces mirabilis]|uniref:Uncharacterized protein n=1 Tax=Recurvomyces mirabilis TaxID=574656 RepID=A0AAE0TSW2_9PEZI|nr:hypothetical protein LTR78_007605 [Recurvomyces mirabilis]KAK5159884.1 hypothetical protein LTS14_001989 [Recurvomyces mirabilis]